MTPLESIKLGVETANWDMVVDGYNRLAPKNKVSKPSKTINQEEEQEEFDDPEPPIRITPVVRTPRQPRMPPSPEFPFAEQSTSTRRRGKPVIPSKINLFYDDRLECLEEEEEEKPKSRKTK